MTVFPHYAERPVQDETTAEATLEASESLRPAPQDALLLEVVLNRSIGVAPETVAALLDRFGCLGAVLAAPRADLYRVEGVSEDMARDIVVLRRLCVAAARTQASQRPVLSSWTELIAYVRTAVAFQPREQFRALFLDRRNRLLRDEMRSEGTVDHAPVYPREVIRRALELSASALILVHNHPSGDPAPSQADITITRQIVDAAKMFGLQVHDHLIVGREGTASLRAMGLM